MSQAPDTRFSRDARLTNAFDYTRVFEKNSRSADRYWTVLSRENLRGREDRNLKGGECNDGDAPIAARLGLAVAKKCAKRAVDRNRLKRLARESFRQHKQSLAGFDIVRQHKQSLAGFDIVLLARHASVSATNQELLKSLEKHWSRITPRLEK